MAAEKMETSKTGSDAVSVPLYRQSGAYAREHNELDAYRASYWANMTCKKAIENTIRDAFDGVRLPKGIVYPVLATFGAERVSYVLANTIRQKEWDGRFGSDNKDWARTIPMTADFDAAYSNGRYIAVETHSAVLDGFIRHMRRAIEEQSRVPLSEQLAKTAKAPDAPGMTFSKPKTRNGEVL